MLAFLTEWQPSEVLTLVAILATALLTSLGLLVWRGVRLAQIKAALKGEMLQRGLSVEEIAQLLPTTARAQTSRTDEEAIRGVAEELAGVGVPPDEAESVMALVGGADSATQQNAFQVVINLSGNGYGQPDKLVAAVRGVCAAARAKAMRPQEPAPARGVDSIMVLGGKEAP